MPAAWDTRTGGGVTIAILDSGVDTTHPDLEAQLVPGWNAYDNNSDTSDVFGHGTQVAGTAAAAGNNSIGVAGVAFGAKIMPIRVTDTSGMGYASSMANGLTWAADKGARAANLSFQGVSGSSTVLSAASAPSMALDDECSCMEKSGGACTWTRSKSLRVMRVSSA